MALKVATTTFICALTLLVERAHCILTVQPRDEYAVKGSTVVLACSTNLDVPAMWMYRRTAGEDQWMFIDQVLNKYSRFKIATDKTRGQYNLTILAVQLEDAGTFRCIDDEGFGFDFYLDGIPNNVATAELNVVDNKLHCVSGVSLQCLREETFEAEEKYNKIDMNCTINFSGTVTPVLIWTLRNKSSGNTSLHKYAKQTVTGNFQYSTLVSELLLPASRFLNQSEISCQLSGSFMQPSSHVTTIIWSSSKVNVIGSGDSFTNPCSILTAQNEQIIQRNHSAILGLGVVGDEIFVLRQNESYINVYDSHSLRSTRDIHIPDMQIPRGLAGCAYNRALYINDAGLKCIHRVDLTNNSVTSWKLEKDQWPHGLSVTAEHTLLVTIRISGKSGVVEYTSEGQLLREIRFDESIEWAWQTVQLSSDQFVVCQGKDSSLSSVCVMNTEGQVIKSYGGRMEEGEGQLNRTYSISVDAKSKHVFVADNWNSRVLMFDSELTFMGQIRPIHTIYKPTRVYFDSSTDRLFVGNSRGQLLIIG